MTSTHSILSLTSSALRLHFITVIPEEGPTHTQHCLWHLVHCDSIAFQLYRGGTNTHSVLSLVSSAPRLHFITVIPQEGPTHTQYCLWLLVHCDSIALQLYRRRYQYTLSIEFGSECLVVQWRSDWCDQTGCSTHRWKVQSPI